MSKYNRFAKDLDAAFKTSRDAYAKAYSQYAQAERAAKDAQRRAALKAEQKEIAKAIKKTDSEALGRAGKLFFAGSWCEDAGKETQAAYDLLRRFFWINCELTVNCEG